MAQTKTTKPTESSTNISAQGDLEKKAKVGLILGLVAVIAWIIPLFGYPVTIIGLIFSAKGLKSSARGMAIAGLILNILFLLATIVNSILGVLLQLKK